MQPRFQSLGNTFLNLPFQSPEDEEEAKSCAGGTSSGQPSVVRRKPTLMAKAKSIPEYIPHHLGQGLAKGTETEQQPRNEEQERMEKYGANEDDVSTECSRQDSKESLQTADSRRTSTSGASSKQEEECAYLEEFTTLVIRNLPHCLSQSRLAHELDNLGFAGLYDFLYLPSTFATNRNKGYAFVNCVTPEDAKCLLHEMHDTVCFGAREDALPLHVSPAATQGYEANVTRWNTSKMRRIRNANHRPLVLRSQVQAPAVLPAGALPAGRKRMTSLRTRPGSLPHESSPHEVAPQLAGPCPHGLTHADLETLRLVTEEVGSALVHRWCVVHGLTEHTHANGRWGFVQALHRDGSYAVNVFTVAQEWSCLEVFPRNLLWRGTAATQPTLR